MNDDRQPWPFPKRQNDAAQQTISTADRGLSATVQKARADKLELMLRDIASLLTGNSDRWEEGVDLVRSLDAQLDLLCAAMENDRQAREALATRLVGLYERLCGAEDTLRLEWLAENTTAARDRYDDDLDATAWYAKPDDGLTPLARIRMAIDFSRRRKAG